MKFIFKIGARAGLAGALLMGPLACARTEPPAPAPADGSDAQRLVALMDYVGGDYRLAVGGGQILRPAEYDEQLRFVADAQSMARGLLGPQAGPSDSLLARLATVESLVKGKAEPEVVAEACHAARDEAVSRFGLRTMPAERPSLARAESLYGQTCVTCHGARGDADTDRARELDPKPASFRDPERLLDLSPYRVYNALTFGVPGTAMASFEALPPADRWSLAFYVFRLGHQGERSEGPVAMTLGDLAGRSDREVRAALQAEGHRDPQAGLVFARQATAFQEPPAGVGLDRTRRLLRQAAASLEAGRATEADRLVLDAYLQGFEPLEPRLLARDPQAVAAVEADFRDLRSAVARGDAGAARVTTRALEDRLERLAGERALVPFLSALLIYFREGVEAALLVGALLAGLRRVGRAGDAWLVHAGWLLALPAGLVTWWLLDRVIALTADQRELMEAGVALLAAAVLFSVSFWMISKAESRHWMAYLQRRLAAGVDKRSVMVLAGVSFLAVYREAAETVLFTQALLLEAGTRRAEVGLGAAAGVLAVVALAFLLNRTVQRLPLGPFFAVSGALLCALAISFAGSGIYALVAAGYLPPRPVRFPEIPWMGIHPDLTGLLVQLAILAVIAGAAVTTLRRPPSAPPA
jgi:high-affinity iron transporter